MRSYGKVCTTARVCILPLLPRQSHYKLARAGSWFLSSMSSTGVCCEFSCQKRVSLCHSSPEFANRNPKMEMGSANPGLNTANPGDLADKTRCQFGIAELTSVWGMIVGLHGC